MSELRCEVNGCNDFAIYEGWYRVKDFAGILTGLIQKRSVCEGHKGMLIAFENSDTEQETPMT